MKTTAEHNFDQLIKDVFHLRLKSLGFKKKGANFYCPKDDFGYHLNFQKSTYYARDNIHFTLNLGVFSPKYWNGYVGEEKLYPSESHCLIRQRIGHFLDEGDSWFELNDDSNLTELHETMNTCLEKHILPFFNSIQSEQDIIDYLESHSNVFLLPISMLIVYSEFGLKDKAKTEFNRMYNPELSPGYSELVMRYGKKYNLC